MKQRTGRSLHSITPLLISTTVQHMVASNLLFHKRTQLISILSVFLLQMIELSLTLTPSIFLIAVQKWYLVNHLIMHSDTIPILLCFIPQKNHILPLNSALLKQSLLNYWYMDRNQTKHLLLIFHLDLATVLMLQISIWNLNHSCFHSLTIPHNSFRSYLEHSSCPIWTSTPHMNLSLIPIMREHNRLFLSSISAVYS